ncbi:UDP-N-acetylglucosamine--N-acetylmuramyl-(pentapeptide) pyrophosphoryl-undecaprenol N-acetylglucosamine transferase [Candidatus Kaiserbacteria bacterium]|nr:UDP-N-acetylglucosamine--N-acetylmuramyl-(pentapeptide) pyrophosphoryl-undecaprenol N-acetylglucosamine transferase [Candidatus Kaiserbacteria bacterium]
MRIALVGGGTGGHFYPLIAVVEAIKKEDPNVDFYYIGPNAYRKDILDEYNINFVKCPAGKLRLYSSIQNTLDLFRVIGGVLVAWYKLYILMPDVIFSKGGYTSVPVLMMARFYRIPVVIHESDSVPGRANKMAKKFAKYIAISYKESLDYFPKEKTALTGIPIREDLINPSAEDPFTTLGIPNDMPLIYITGGSSGAERINDVVLQTLPDLLSNYRVFHQTGVDNEESVRVAVKTLIQDDTMLDRYYIKGELDVNTVSAILRAASLVISRAGSTTLHEISIHGKPSIIIPIPESISRDQRTNAYAYTKTGAGLILEESNLTRNLLVEQINTIMTNADKYKTMSQIALQFAHKDAAQKLTQILLKTGRDHG